MSDFLTNSYGALRLHSVTMLLKRQEETCVKILTDILHLSKEEASYRKEGKDNYNNAMAFRRPHHVFTIDGGRGTGKTTTLLTLHYFLGHLGSDGTQLGNEDTKLWFKNHNFLAAESPGDDYQKLTLPLPLIFPNEMAHTETVIENVFALLHNFLEKYRSKLESDLMPPTWETRDFRDFVKGQRDGNDYKQPRLTKLQKIEALLLDLKNNVARGWTFSQELGEELLGRDSLDFQDYVGRRSEQVHHSYLRIETWRDFVNTFLDTFGYRFLVICIDDTDLSPIVGEGILHAIRMYFCHPRIITILSVNYNTLRYTLQTLAFRRLSESLRVIPDNFQGKLKHEWLQHEQKTVNQYLEKLLPPRYRVQTSVTAEDLLKLFPPNLYEFISEQRMLYTDKKKARKLWLLCNAYQRMIINTDSVRTLINFKDIIRTSQEDISSFLLEQPGFYEIGRLMRSYPTGIIDALQTIEIKLTNATTIDFKKESFHSRDIEFDLLCYLYDCALMDAICEEDVSTSLKLSTFLVKPPGLIEKSPDAYGRQPFLMFSYIFQDIPRNCFYLNDYLSLERAGFLRRIPDLRFRSQWKNLLSVQQSLAIYPDLYRPLKGKTNEKKQEAIANLFFSLCNMHMECEPEKNPNKFIPAFWLAFSLLSNTPYLTDTNFIEALDTFDVLAKNTAKNWPQEFSKFIDLCYAYLKDQHEESIRRESVLEQSLLLTHSQKMERAFTDRLLFALDDKNDVKLLRAPVLCGWSVSPLLSAHLMDIQLPFLKWGANAWDQEKMLAPLQRWQAISHKLADLANKLEHIGPSVEDVFPDLSDSFRKRIQADLCYGANELTETVHRVEKQWRASAASDPFALDKNMQLALLLNISHAKAVELARLFQES